MTTIIARIPIIQDFPSDVVLQIVPPSGGKAPSNVLILLHGLGDNHQPFAVLGSRFNFPETVCIALRAPLSLPFANNGFNWGDDVLFDQSTGTIDMDTGFKKTEALMKTVVEDVLVEKCKWSRRAIFIFGFGQGGMAGLHLAASLSPTGPDGEFGGVVSVGGPLPHSSPSPHPKAKTPVLVIGAEKKSAVTDTSVARIQNVFEAVNIVRWKGRTGDGMMKNAEETRPIMEFLARRFRSRAGIPSGAVELR